VIPDGTVARDGVIGWWGDGEKENRRKNRGNGRGYIQTIFQTISPPPHLSSPLA